MIYLMTPECEVLLEMYKVQVSRSEHYENMRGTLINYLFVISGVLISIAVFDRQFSGTDTWVGVTLTILGVSGFAASSAHGRRSWRHGARAKAYRDALDSEIPGARINAIRKTVPRTKTYLNLVWNAVPSLIAVIGLAITLLSSQSQVSG